VLFRALAAAAMLVAATLPGVPVAAAGAAFTDSFDIAVDNDPGYGLNDSLATRQNIGGITYTRVSGLWNNGTAPRSWYSQVDHPQYPGRLAYFLGTSAVRLDAPAIADAVGATTVSATLTPVVGSTTSSDWSSLILSHSATSWGYVTNADVDLGVLVRANGGVQVFQAGKLVRDLPGFAAGGTGSYGVGLAVTGAALTLVVGTASATITLPAAVPQRAWLNLGRYAATSTTTVSSVDDLAVGAMDATALRPPAGSHLHYVGYYAARMTVAGGNHLPEVAGRSNLNFVTISDPDKYRPEVLADCAPASCIVYTGNEFFKCATSSCSLYPNAAQRWATLASQVRPYLDRIAAFSVLDEPSWRGANPTDVTTSAQDIKQSYPNTPILLNEAGPAVTSAFHVPDQVDWVSFDWYCQPMSTINSVTSTLERQVPDRAGRELFLFAEVTPICAGQNDQTLAAGLSQYRQIGEAHPRVAGIILFGPWTGVGPNQPPAGMPTPSQYPLSTDAQERLAARILGAH
jgi:hypothetical protein